MVCPRVSVPSSRPPPNTHPQPPPPKKHTPTPTQLETTIGSVIKDFGKVVVMHVPRARYLPVKSTSDLFLVQSNLYSVSRGMLLLNPARCVACVFVVVCRCHCDVGEATCLRHGGCCWWWW